MQALLAPRPATRLLLDHVAPVRISVHDAVAELLQELPARRAHVFFPADRRPRRAPGDHRPFPGPAGAVQAGLVDLEQASSFGELHVQWLGRRRGGTGLDSLDVDEYQG